MENTQELKILVHVDLTEIPCNIEDPCIYKERTISYALGVDIPVEPVVDPEVVFNECCYVHRVYADANSAEDYKNDYSSFYHQRQLSNETVKFELEHLNTGDKYELNNSTYGTFYGFGSFPENINFTGYLVQWKKVLEEIGPGSYKINKTVNKIGIEVVFPSFVFTLSQYSAEKADRTVRFDIVQNGKYEDLNVDFTGLSWKHSLRVPGFFGRRNPQYEEDTLIDTNFNDQQVSISQSNQYRFQTKAIPDCITDELHDFILMANEIFVNDYNLNNHSYKFRKFSIKIESTEEPTYTNTSRKAVLNMIFTKRIVNNLKRNYR